MENLIEKISSYNNCVQGLLDRINEYVDMVHTNVPQEFWGLLRVKDAGNSEFYWVTAFIEGEYAEDKLIPTTTSKCGKGQYAYGDLHCWRNFATRKEVVDFAKELPDLIKKADRIIQEQLEEAQSIE